MPLLVFCVALLLFASLPLGTAAPPPLLQSVFVSCNKPDGDQRYWPLIAAAAAPAPVDAFVWLGDVVYADSHSLLRGFAPCTNFTAARAMFVRQRDAPAYALFRHTSVRPRAVAPFDPRVMGVWDDHDMGKNDGGAEYAGKDAMQDIFLDFLGVSANRAEDERRRRRGLYSFEAVPFPPAAGAAAAALQRHFDAAACFLLLDARYFRDPANASRSGDMLGEEQWAWMEERLRRDVSGRNPKTGRERCAITVVGNGVQFIMDEKFSESWGAFPNSRDRLFALLRKYRTERVVFVTGDVHLAEIGMDATRAGIEVLGYPVVEGTSSGLTHSWGDSPGLAKLVPHLFPSNRRVGMYVERNFGILRMTADPDAFGGNANDATSQRAYLEDHINVSIAIHSIALMGETVLQLSLPLSALTYRSGCQFLDASIRSDGFADLRTKDHEKCEVPLVKDSIHYSSTHPEPSLTRLLRFLQWHVWPHLSLIGVVEVVVFRSALFFVVIILAVLLRFIIKGSALTVVAPFPRRHRRLSKIDKEK